MHTYNSYNASVLYPIPMLYVHVSKCSLHRVIILLDLHATLCVTSVALHPPIDKTGNVPALIVHTCYISRIHRQRKRARCASKFPPTPSPFYLVVVAITISLSIFKRIS